MRLSSNEFFKKPEPEIVPDSVAQFVIRCAQPLSRRFNNPFFALEMQILKRWTHAKGQTSSAEILVLFSLGIMALSLMMLVFSRIDTVIPDPAFAGGLVSMVGFGHLFLCGIGTAWGAGRIFQREHISGTLQDLFLLPFPAWLWVLQKSQTTLFVLALAWLSALPFHFVLCAAATILAGTITPVVLFKALFLPLWLGLAIWAYTLILMPDYLCDPPRPAPEGEYSRAPWQDTQFSLQSASAARYLLALGFGLLSCFGWMNWIFDTPNDINPLLQLRTFYDMMAPVGLFWITLHIGFFAAALAHSAAMLSPEHEGRRRSAAICWCALASSYYTLLGFLWPPRPNIVCWAALIAPPFVMVLFSRLSECWQPAPILEGEEDGTDHVKASKPPGKRRLLVVDENWSRREVEWLAKRYDNAIFVKDLRVHLRGSSFFMQCFWSVFWTVIALLLIKKIGLANSNWWLWLSTYFAYPAARSVAMWQQEARGVTLTMLLLSPIASREIIRGRVWASLITGLSWPLTGLGILAYLIAGSTLAVRFAAWPGLFSAVAVPILALVLDATKVPGEDMEQTQVVHNGNGGCLAQLLLVPSVLLAWLCGGLPMWLQWTLSLLLIWIYGALAVMFFDEGVLKLDKRRLLAKPVKPNYRRY